MAWLQRIDDWCLDNAESYWCFAAVAVGILISLTLKRVVGKYIYKLFHNQAYVGVKLCPVSGEASTSSAEPSLKQPIMRATVSICWGDSRRISLVVQRCESTTDARTGPTFVDNSGAVQQQRISS